MVEGIYIHIPFCLNKCRYCDFLSFKSDNLNQDRYTEAVLKEIDLYELEGLRTIYFGGGTPSLLSIDNLKKILSKFDLNKIEEITLEVNPKTVTKDKLIKIKELGINRLSIGIQSFNNRLLELLGRKHNIEEGKEVYNWAREVGFENISLDLMFSLPTQTIEDLNYDLDEIFRLYPEHISIYSLIWEEGTDFYAKLLKGELKETDNEVEAKMYELIIERCKSRGYRHYEISNFALEGKEAIHNSNYWRNKEYIGIGLGASGYYRGERYENYRDFHKYYESIGKKVKPISNFEIVSKIEEIESYKYMLGLRLLIEGVEVGATKKNIFEELERDGYIEKKGKRYILTHKGLMIGNDIFSKFI